MEIALHAALTLLYYILLYVFKLQIIPPLFFRRFWILKGFVECTRLFLDMLLMGFLGIVPLLGYITVQLIYYLVLVKVNSN